MMPLVSSLFIRYGSDSFCITIDSIFFEAKSVTEHHDIDRRLDKLEREQEKMEDILQQLVLSTTRMGDLLESQKAALPKIEHLTEEMTSVKIQLSNAQLIQRGVMWLAGIIGSSAIVMAMTYLFNHNG